MKLRLMFLLPVLAGAPVAASAQSLSTEAQQLWDVVSCKSDKPSVDVPNYAKYCKLLAAEQATYQKRVGEKAKVFFKDKRPTDLPTTELYPFSGADVVSSLAAYPDATTYVHISLEQAGPPDRLSAIKPAQRRTGLDGLLSVMRGLFQKGNSTSVSLRAALEEAIPGVLPMYLVGIDTYGGTVTGLRYFDIDPSGEIVYLDATGGADKKMAKKLDPRWVPPPFEARYANVEISFTVPWDTRPRVLRHLAANLDDEHMKQLPGVGAFLKKLGTVSYLTKAAHYLLWRDDFTIIRDIGLAQAAFIVQDSSGYGIDQLPDTSWEVKAYGKFACDYLKLRGYGRKGDQRSLDLAKFFKGAPELGFRFGYPDCKGQHHVMLAKRKK
ncbi:MAG: hypothetical protein IT370_21680 [Deltaproteobacteria bacterium]|nr:hypothetical protein [Deltaproteobacteria bacterium]